VTVRARLPLLAALALALAGCGSSSGQAGVPATLPPTAIPYLPSVHKPLTATFLAREAQAPTLVHLLNGWGFEAAADRYFQGESRRLQMVDSRTLQFSRSSGASAYVAFMRLHLNPILGSYPKIKAFGRGIVATAQECQCHLANPAFLTLVAHGRTVTWLEINGPGATRRQLAALVQRAP
jgi:hypothetical protein